MVRIADRQLTQVLVPVHQRAVLIPAQVTADGGVAPVVMDGARALHLVPERTVQTALDLVVDLVSAQGTARTRDTVQEAEAVDGAVQAPREAVPAQALTIVMVVLEAEAPLTAALVMATMAVLAQAVAAQAEMDGAVLVRMVPEVPHPTDLVVAIVVAPVQTAGAWAPDPMVTEAPDPMATEAPHLMATEVPDLMVTETPVQMVTETPVQMVTETPDPMATETPDPMAMETPDPMATEIPHLMAITTTAPAEHGKIQR